MHIGAVFPQLEIGNDPAEIAHWARGVEELGYHHVLAFDHVVGAGTATRPDWQGYTSDDAFHEVFVLLGYLAALTSSVELATGVLVLPQRQTALVAKQAAAVDVLSGGRMRLGVGVGWNPVEYQALGEDFRNRGARSEEQIEVLRALWAEAAVTVRGRWHTIVDAGINPRPVRGSIPIWIGGTSDAALERAGRIGDGWFPQGPPDAESARMLGRVRAAAVAAGRVVTDVGIEPRLVLGEHPAESWRGFLRGWSDMGATHVCVSTMGAGFTGVDEHLAALAAARDVHRAVVS
jgi:probable F420-dependent oxidoreductase